MTAGCGVVARLETRPRHLGAAHEGPLHRPGHRHRRRPQRPRPHLRRSARPRPRQPEGDGRGRRCHEPRAVVRRRLRRVLPPGDQGRRPAGEGGRRQFDRRDRGRHRPGRGRRFRAAGRADGHAAERGPGGGRAHRRRRAPGLPLLERDPRQHRRRGAGDRRLTSQGLDGAPQQSDERHSRRNLSDESAVRRFRDRSASSLNRVISPTSMSVSVPGCPTCRHYSACRVSPGWVTTLAFARRSPVPRPSTGIALAPGGRVPARHLARPAGPRRRAAAAGTGVVALLLLVLGVALAPTPLATAADTTSMLRLGQLDPDQGNLELTVSSVADPKNTVLIAALGYGELSPYQAVEEGDYVVATRPAGSSEPPMVAKTISVRPGTTSTVATVGA